MLTVKRKKSQPSRVKSSSKATTNPSNLRMIQTTMSDDSNDDSSDDNTDNEGGNDSDTPTFEGAILSDSSDKETDDTEKEDNND